MFIHPLAAVHSEAEIGRDVHIGPFAVIERGVMLGDRCRVESHAVIKSGTQLGADNHVCESAILGGLPQHINKPTHVGTIQIGQRNTIREHCTVHRALHEGTTTIIGDDNLLMAGTHVAHDCIVGSHAIFANNATLGGHVIVEDRAYVSGNVAVHQFCRIGRFAMVGGLARVVQDVPPFVLVDGVSGLVVGLNTVGLRRNGFTAEDMSQLKRAYRVLYRSGLTWRQTLDRLESEFTSGPASELFTFLNHGGTRGIVRERRMPQGSTVRIDDHLGTQHESWRAKAG